MGYPLKLCHIDHLTDVTSFIKADKRLWNFLCGDMNEASVTINTYKIPKELRGVDYSNNDELRLKLKTFLEDLGKEG